MVRRPSPELVEESTAFECVRVTNMAGVNLSMYRFDYDLTFAALLMNADGTVYHHYGNRDGYHADSHLSEASLRAAMKATLADHAARPKDAPPPELPEPLTIEQMPTMARRIAAGKAPECYHCHNVNDAIGEDAREKGTWKDTMVWRWPPSERIGLVTHRDDQTRVWGVLANTPAGALDLVPGFHLKQVAGRTVATEGDVQSILEGLPGTAQKLPIVLEQGGKTREIELALPDGWKVGEPIELAWRASMWPLSPAPGFGGKPLTADEKRSLELPTDNWAFRVGYIVTWGARSHTGRNAAKAGIRKEMVVHAIDGKDDFESMQHFHAWFRLTRKIGEEVEISVVRRDGERATLRMKTVAK